MSAASVASALPVGSQLDNRYTIERVLGAGGFGITYAARHGVLGRTVAIKEHFPRQLAYRDGQTDRVLPTDPGTYRWALERFLQEGRALARCRHPNVVEVSDVFEANNTAYMVLAYEEGESLAAWLGGLGRLPSQNELDRIVAPLLDALEAIHAQSMLHRDIAPDNIILRPDGSPCLIDFGAARQSIAGQSQALSAIVKKGYSPPEQYATSGRAQGPWSDIYALGATLYRAVTGLPPPEATERLIEDSVEPATDVDRGGGPYRQSFLDGIDAALRLRHAERPQSVAEWRETLLRPAPTSPPHSAATGTTTRQSPGAASPAEPVHAPDPQDSSRNGSVRLVLLLAVAAVLFAVLAAAGWYANEAARRSEAAAAAESARRLEAERVAREKAAADEAAEARRRAEPQNRQCGGLDIVRCNAAPGCQWRVLSSSCVAFAASPAAPGPGGTSGQLCSSVRRRGECDALRHCSWSVSRGECRDWPR